MRNTDRQSRRARRRGRSIVAVGVALGVSALVLSGCSGASGDDGDASTFTVWHYNADGEQLKYVTYAVDAFKEAHPDIDVEAVYVPYDQLQQKLINSVGAKTGPDVVLFNCGNTSTLAAAGALAPLDEYWDGFADKDDFSEAALHHYDDQLYAVGGVSDLLALWYNKDLMDQLGIAEPPTTIDELEDDLALAKAAGIDGITLTGLPNDQGEYQSYPWLTAFGFDFDDPKAEALEQAYTTVHDWVEQGYLSKEVVTWDQTVPFQEFMAGNVLFAENGNWQAATAAANADFEYGVAPLPISPDGKVYASGTHPAIGAFAKDKALAWEFIEQGYLTKDAEIASSQSVGGVPANRQLLTDPAIADDPILEGLTRTLADFGAEYPSSAINPDDVGKAQTLLGQTWSAVLGSQKSPSDAADEVIAKLSPMLAGN